MYIIFEVATALSWTMPRCDTHSNILYTSHAEFLFNKGNLSEMPWKDTSAVTMDVPFPMVHRYKGMTLFLLPSNISMDYT